MRFLTGLAVVLALAGAGGVAAQDEVPVETARLGKSQVTLTRHAFLTEQEVTTLHLVMSNRQALSVFVPGKPDAYSALAVSPDEGFIREGKPVASAVAVADLPDADTARLNAVEACDKARNPKHAPCVVVLEVGPARKK
jgi:hypothetical protein